MKLLTKEILEKFDRVNKNKFTAEGVENEKNPKIIAKYFHPFCSATWYATEYDPQEKKFFGFVAGLTGNPIDDEWGYFDLQEMESLRVHGLPMERDSHFGNPKASEISEINRYYKRFN